MRRRKTDRPNGKINNRGNPAAQGTSGVSPVAKLDTSISMPVFDQVSPVGSVTVAENVPADDTVSEETVNGVMSLGKPLGKAYTLIVSPIASPEKVHVAVPVVVEVVTMVINPSWPGVANDSTSKLGPAFGPVGGTVPVAIVDAIDMPPKANMMLPIIPTAALARQIADDLNIGNAPPSINIHSGSMMCKLSKLIKA